MSKKSSMKLHQLLALEGSVRAAASSIRDKTNHLLKKKDLFSGMNRVYRPFNDDDVKYPDDSKRVQVRSETVIHDFVNAFSDMWNLSFQRDVTNCDAKADVVVDGHVIISKAPVTFLLALEKQLEDFRTVLNNWPTLDEVYDWEKDDKIGLYKTKPMNTIKTDKRKTPIVCVEATKEHPAQYEMDTKDVPVGTWENVQLSGALPRTEIENRLYRLNSLHKAVKVAREEANQAEVKESADIGKNVFNYILGG